MTRKRPAVRRAAGVVLLRGRGAALEVLLLRNAREGHWGFAKGHLDEGEGEVEGALREVLEETGLVPRLDPSFRESIRYTVLTGKHAPFEKEVVYFLGEPEAGSEPRASEEHDRMEWLPLAAALERLDREALRTILTRAVEHKGAMRG